MNAAATTHSRHWFRRGLIAALLLLFAGLWHLAGQFSDPVATPVADGSGWDNQFLLPQSRATGNLDLERSRLYLAWAGHGWASSHAWELPFTYGRVDRDDPQSPGELRIDFRLAHVDTSRTRRQFSLPDFAPASEDDLVWLGGPSGLQFTSAPCARLRLLRIEPIGARRAGGWGPFHVTGEWIWNGRAGACEFDIESHRDRKTIHLTTAGQIPLKALGLSEPSAWGGLWRMSDRLQFVLDLHLQRDLVDPASPAKHPDPAASDPSESEGADSDLPEADPAEMDPAGSEPNQR